MTQEKSTEAEPAEESLAGVLRAYDTVKRMVKKGGCAWHEEQTHESLTRYLIEETYELAEAIETGAPAKEVSEELGDVLYQVLFHAAIAELTNEGYSLDTVGEALAAKLIARHPHVFGDTGYMTLKELEAEWEHLKEAAAGEARGSRHALEGIPAGMPPIARAAKVVDRLHRAGLLETPAAEETEAPQSAEEDLGDRMLALVKEAYGAGIDPDRALRQATQRLIEKTTNQGVEY